jgi:hypothetical protein
LGHNWGVRAALCVLLVSVTAGAKQNDISARGVGRPASHDGSDPAVQRYSNLSNELAVALSPKGMTPAETLGINGFEFSLGMNVTPIRSERDYWQGQPGMPVFEGVATGGDVPDALVTPVVQLRKGLPLSTEIAISGTYLASSQIFMLGTDLKIAWHESYFRWVPAFATRLSAGRLFGASDLDLITAEADAILSLPIGLGGMLQLTPYFGMGVLMVHVNSQVIDETPYRVSADAEQRGGQRGSLYNFPTLDLVDNRHTRAIIGCRVISAFVSFVYEIGVTRIDARNMQTHSIKLAIDV